MSSTGPDQILSSFSKDLWLIKVFKYASWHSRFDKILGGIRFIFCQAVIEFKQTCLYMGHVDLIITKSNSAGHFSMAAVSFLKCYQNVFTHWYDMFALNIAFAFSTSNNLMNECLRIDVACIVRSEARASCSDVSEWPLSASDLTLILRATSSLIPIMTSVNSFRYITKPKSASEFPKRAVRIRHCRRSMHGFLSHVHGNASVTSKWCRCH